MMFGRIAALGATLALTAASPGPQSTSKALQWTRAWTASMWQAPDRDARVLENVTLRSAVRVGAGGGMLRLRLANDYGDAIQIGAASLRLPGGKTVAVTFGGRTSMVLPAHAPLVSDGISLPLKEFDVVEVSLFLPKVTKLNTVHDIGGQPTLISMPGDFTQRDFTPATKWNLRPLIAGLDVSATRPRPVIVAFGDSITDNTLCANDAMPRCRWGDVLGRRLAAAGKPHVVVTQAISGNRILAEGWGPSALARFDRDVLAIPNVSHVIVLEGINDIGNSGKNGNPLLTAEQLVQGFTELARRAHAKGIKVIGATILPYKGAGYYSQDGEAIRQKVNAWIRTTRHFDGFVDLEKAVADPTDPARLSDAMQGGDNLHPDGRGETAMGEAVSLNLFD